MIIVQGNLIFFLGVAVFIVLRTERYYLDVNVIFNYNVISTKFSAAGVLLTTNSAGNFMTTRCIRVKRAVLYVNL
jgi:hypothetical protein